MASHREQNMKYRRYSGRVNGNLAYDPAYEERQRRLRREREYEREHERLRRIHASPAAEGAEKGCACPPSTRKGLARHAVRFYGAGRNGRADDHVPRTADGNLRAGRLRAEGDLRARGRACRAAHALRKTFDLTTIKETAAAAGMAKPSASQVYYIDLSEPDSVVVYQQKSQNVLSRALTSLGNGVCAVVEYFK